MRYCRIHGSYVDSHDGCPDCQAAQQRAEEDRAAALEFTERAAWKSHNPGDHECPHCKYISLKFAATRCPLCHGKIDALFWQEVAVRAEASRIDERRRSQLAAAELERTRPQRLAAAQANWIRRNAPKAYGCFFVWLLPALSIATSLPILAYSLAGSPEVGTRHLMIAAANILGTAALPIANWFYVFVLFDRPIMLRPILGFIVAGWAVGGPLLVRSMLKRRSRRAVSVA